MVCPTVILMHLRGMLLIANEQIKQEHSLLVQLTFYGRTFLIHVLANSLVSQFFCGTICVGEINDEIDKSKHLVAYYY